MSKVFAQVTPSYEGEVVAVEVDVNVKENYALVDKYKVMTIPTSILIDSDGKVIDGFSGLKTAEEMKEKLDLLLSSVK